MTVEKRDRCEALSPTEQQGRVLSGLSPLQLRVLLRLRQNVQHNAIAQELGLSGSELTTQIRQILTSIGAHDRAALLVMVGLATAIS
jgi:DNA-binding NarL/FixJ family response regulator